jgi:transcriptional regulator of arginine metabolism
MLKTKRQEKILGLIKTKRIKSQSNLTAQLERAGFYATQSSVSRDLIELGAVKVKGFYALPNVTDKASSHGLINLDTAGEILIVAKTESGLASAVAVQIDNANIKEIVGTVAGDDTIFIAVKDRKEQRNAIKKIWEIFD